MNPKRITFELLSSIAVSFFFRVFGAGSTFIFTILLTRQLGAGESGVFLYCFALVTFVSTISRFGLDNTVLRFSGQGNFSTNILAFSVLSKSLLIALFFSTFFTILILLLSSDISILVFNDVSKAHIIKYFSISIVPICVFTLCAMYLQGQRKTVTSILFLNVLVNLLMIILIWFFNVKKLLDIVVIYSGINVFVGAVSFIYVRTRFFSENEIVRWRTIFKSCAPLFVVVLMTQLIQWFSQIYGGVWLDQFEIAYLAASQRCALLISFILIAVNLVVAPRFSQFFKDGRLDKVQNLVDSSFYVLILISMPLAIIVFFFHNEIMSLFGTEFSDYGSLLLIMGFGQLINVVTGSVGFLLSMSGNERELRNVSIVSATATVLCGLFFIPLFGLYGAAWTTFIGVVVQNLFCVYKVKTVLNIKMFNFVR